jgi:exosome complex exonuclease RRP6
MSSEDKIHLNELVDKIHRSFLIVIPETLEKIDLPTDVSSMDVEIPFIPAPQRSITVMNEEQDTIVVVGQARQKRKRPKASTDGVEATSGKKTKITQGVEAKDEDGEAFDFSAVPNILDDNPNLGDEKNKKKRRERKEKKGGAFYGDFPAAPKAYSELKSGNQSHTFK